MSSRTLDEIIYKILFQETSLENIQQLLRENSAQKQQLCIPSTKVKMRRQRTQLYTEKTVHNNDKQQIIDKFISKSELNSDNQTSDQMFCFTHDNLEDDSLQELDKINENNNRSQLKSNTKRNLKEQIDNHEYITPQKFILKEQSQLPKTKHSQRDSKEKKVFEIDVNELSVFNSFSIIVESNMNFLENPIKVEKENLNKKSKNQGIEKIKQTNCKINNHEKDVNKNQQTQISEFSQISVNDQQKLDDWLSKFIHKKPQQKIDSKICKQQKEMKELIESKHDQEANQFKRKFDVNKEIYLFSSQKLSKQSNIEMENDPAIQEFQKSLYSSIANMLKDSQINKKQVENNQNKLLNQQNLFKQKLGTYELIDYYYSMNQSKDNNDNLVQQPNQIDKNQEQNTNEPKKVEILQKTDEKNSILFDKTFDIFFNQI